MINLSSSIPCFVTRRHLLRRGLLQALGWRQPSLDSDPRSQTHPPSNKIMWQHPLHKTNTATLIPANSKQHNNMTWFLSGFVCNDQQEAPVLPLSLILTLFCCPPKAEPKGSCPPLKEVSLALFAPSGKNITMTVWHKMVLRNQTQLHLLMQCCYCFSP